MVVSKHVLHVEDCVWYTRRIPALEAEGGEGWGEPGMRVFTGILRSSRLHEKNLGLIS